MSKTYAVINPTIEAETEKAVLVEAINQVWLPKSQVIIHKIENCPWVVELPTWLWVKNQYSLPTTTTPEAVFNSVGYLIHEYED